MSKTDKPKNDAPKRAAKPKPAAKVKEWVRTSLSPKAIAQWAESAVLEAAQNADLDSGEKRAKAAVDALARKVDAAIEPPNPFAELASDAAIAAGRIILAALVEDAFRRLRKQGRA